MSGRNHPSKAQFAADPERAHDEALENDGDDNGGDEERRA